MRRLVAWSQQGCAAVESEPRRCAYLQPIINQPPVTNDNNVLCSCLPSPTGWRRGAVVSGVRRMNEVSASRARLVPGRVTVFGRVYHLGM